MMNMIASIFLVWCSTIANTSVDAFAFTPSTHHHLATAMNKPFVSQTRLYEAVVEEEGIDTLLRSATIYGDLVADENIRYVNLTRRLSVIDC